MKPITEWLQQLPDGYRERALHNHKYHSRSNYTSARDLGCAILDGFHWTSTPEQGAFWLRIYQAIKDDKPLPPLPADKETGRRRDVMKLGLVIKRKPTIRKTIWKHLCELNAPYRAQALANCKPSVMDELANSQAKALLYAFDWRESPQGHGYWDRLHDHLDNQTPLSAQSDTSEKAPTQHTPTPTMDPKYNDQPVANITAVFGRDVSTMSANDCLNAIKGNNAAAKALTDTGITSAYIEEQVAKYKAANEVLIRQLDSFAKPTA